MQKSAIYFPSQMQLRQHYWYAEGLGDCLEGWSLRKTGGGVEYLQHRVEGMLSLAITMLHLRSTWCGSRGK